MKNGIHTGIVIVEAENEDGAFEFTGETPDIAARLQELAPPGGIAVSALTRRLAGSAFQFRTLRSEHAGFGSAEPEWFEVAAATEVPEAESGLRKTPIGRPRSRIRTPSGLLGTCSGRHGSSGPAHR